MPVRAKVFRSSVEVEITNSENSPADRRKEAPRQEYLNRKDALVLIRELTTALEHLEEQATT